MEEWLTAAEARCERASKGPWHHLLPEIPYLVYGKRTTSSPILESVKRPFPSEADAAFVAAARSDLPRALGLLRKAMELVAAAKREVYFADAPDTCNALAAFDAAVKNGGGG